MSSDQRVKKLRGSGGYVMASVGDEQQRKGNLGGPDLFLAPIGRLGEEKISRYFCNTCEKDYEGCPSIEFESPNEEVADNLILAERGQYLCKECGSTIAEYREFKKPDEMAEVGLARPTEQIMPAQETLDIPSELPQAQQDTLTESFGTMQIPETTPAEYTQKEEYTSDASSVKPLVGMSVFDENGVKVGVAGQVGVDHAQNVVLVVSKDDGTEAVIPWAKIKKVGEIILLGDPSEPQAPKSNGCASCGFENKPGSKFCEQCGSKQ